MSAAGVIASAHTRCRRLVLSISRESYMRRTFALVFVASSVVACSNSVDTKRVPLGGTSSTTAETSVPSTTTAAVASGDVQPGGALTGTLLEQIAAAPYTYLRIKSANGEVWAAVNQASLTVGSPVTVYGVLLMEKFQSKTLNRTFDRIYFGSLDAPNAANAPPSAIAGADAAPTSVGTPPAVDAKVGKIAKASGADARTIAELWSQKDGMAGKTVSVRGVVVKYNPGVMGKNWIHLQDGSGDATKSTHDITVTSTDLTVLGATVTITGTARTNKDFGAGYSYALIVEDAKVVVK